MDPDLLPVIVGVGQVNDRPADPAAGMDPVALMAEALRRAEADAHASPDAQLLADADSLAVVRQISFPAIEDASPLVAQAIGAGRAELFQTALPGGESPVRLLNEAANRIGAGEIAVALVCGGEALRTAAARVAADEGRRLDPVREAPHRTRTGHAAQHGLIAPVDVYPLYENAMRAALGQTLAQAQAETGAMWAAFSRVAADNPQAWVREAVTAEQVTAPGAGNRPVAFPYTKLQVANSSVNQGAGFIVTSAGEARRRGIAPGKWVYVGNGAAANEQEDLLARDSFARSASMEAALTQALALNGLTADDLDAVELYSCFPCIPKLARRVIGWPLDKPASVVGGLTFGGGPVGNFMSHAVARMAQLLRREGGTGLLFGNGGLATRNHVLPLSARPIAGAAFPRGFDVQAEADAARGAIPPLAEDYLGPATVETWVVYYGRDRAASGGAVMARTPDGARTLAHVLPDDAATVERLASVEPEAVGAPGVITRIASRRAWRFV